MFIFNFYFYIIKSITCNLLNSILKDLRSKIPKRESIPIKRKEYLL